MHTDYHLSRVESLERFRELEPEWSALVAAAQLDSPFLLHAWLSCWWEVWGAEKELWTLVARERGRVAGILPLMLDRATRTLEFMGAGRIMPHGLDIIASPDDRRPLARAFWQYLWEERDRWNLVDLSDVAPGSPLSEVDEEAEVRVSAAAPYAELPNTFEEYLQDRGAKTRKHLNYNRRLLARDFPVARFGRVETVSELESTFAALVDLHQARWSKRGESGAFEDEDFRRFHRAAAQAGLADGTLRMYYLTVQDAPAAVLYCYRVGARVSYYNGGFDERWSKYSIGVLILAYALEQSIAEGAREFDFLQGLEDYKNHWATGVREDLRVRAASPHLRGQLAWARLHSQENLLRFAKHVVPRETRQTLKQWIQRS